MEVMSVVDLPSRKEHWNLGYTRRSRPVLVVWEVRSTRAKTAYNTQEINSSIAVTVWEVAFVLTLSLIVASYMSCGKAPFFQQGRREGQGGQICGLDHLGIDTIAALPFERASITLSSSLMAGSGSSWLWEEWSNSWGQQRWHLSHADRVQGSVSPISVHLFLEVCNGFAVFCFKGYSFLFWKT